MPRKDPRPEYEADELRVISPREVQPYLSILFPNLDRLSARYAHAKGQGWVGYQPRRPEELIREWTSGDAAVVVRLRDGRPIKMAFFELVSPRRIRVKMVLGKISGPSLTIRRWTSISP